MSAAVHHRSPLLISAHHIYKVPTGVRGTTTTVSISTSGQKFFSEQDGATGTTRLGEHELDNTIWGLGAADHL